jgi:hypothetical protein
MAHLEVVLGDGADKRQVVLEAETCAPLSSMK